MSSAIAPASGWMDFGDWSVHPVRRELRVRGSTVELVGRPMDVLLMLCQNRNRLVTRDELLDQVWPGIVVEENNVSVHISALRKLIGSKTIATIAGRGYRLSAVMDGESDSKSEPQPASLSTQVSGNLALMPEPLIGRDAELHQLNALILGGGARLVTLVGTGGLGKTRLAIAAAEQMRDSFPDGAWLVELAALPGETEGATTNDTERLATAIAQAMRLSLPARRPAGLEVVESLRDSRCVIVLDNCEHLLNTVATFLRRLLRETRCLQVLATSQAQLAIDLEQKVALQALGLPRSDAVEEVLRSSAVQLLQSRVRGLMRSDFAVDQQNAADAAAICRKLDGLPLAIELAAARVRFMTIPKVRAMLDDRLLQLGGYIRTEAPRHRDLSSMIAWSYELLRPDEQKVFRRCSVFLGSFGLAQAERILRGLEGDDEATADLLFVLVDRSLVVLDQEEPPRYRMLYSTREFGLQRLGGSAEETEVRRLHALAMLDLFESERLLQWTLPSQQLLARCLPDLENCHAALCWADEAQMAALQIALAGASAWLFNGVGQTARGLQHCDKALARIDPATPLAMQARLWMACSELSHYVPGDGKLQAAQRAVALQRLLADDDQALYTALGRLAINAALCGNKEIARQAVEDMKPLRAKHWPPAAEPGQRWPSMAKWDELHACDFVANLSGDLAAGEDYAAQQLTLATAFNDLPKIRFAHLASEQCAGTRGDFSRAVEIGRELVRKARLEPFVERLQIYVGNHATALLMNGQIEEGLAMAREAVVLNARHETLGKFMELFALAALCDGRPEDAAVPLGRSIRVARASGGMREPVEAQVYKRLAHELRAARPAGFKRLLLEGRNLHLLTERQIADIGVWGRLTLGSSNIR